MIKNLIKAAADLDAAGFIVEADLMDRIMQKVAASSKGNPFGFITNKKTAPKDPAAKKPAKKEVAPEEDDDEDMLASLQSAAEDDGSDEDESEDEESDDEGLEDSEEEEYGDEDEEGDISEEDEEDGVTISAQECLEHCMMLSIDEKCALMKALLDSISEE